ncbi:hypothetical protein [Sulfurospirillum arcachonense]|uniref:hypothetical protein n=1 Tax=Sulfurospirillum arcachonense TaxID=57666 RepID=UPI00046A4AC4|nr:hypothetical protein [Sulfurospirillum arcachonense]
MHKYILILLALFLVGCSPKYVVKKQYIPKKEKSFAGCVQTCEVEKSVCKQDCKNQFDFCMSDAYTRSKDISNIEFLKYDEEYEEYLLKLSDYKRHRHQFDRNYRKVENDYRYFRKRCARTKKHYPCYREHELNKKLLHMRSNVIVYPVAPIKPSFEAILVKQQSFCKSNCGCDESFDRCYVECGGAVVPYKFCIKNCD